jgi:hypothetical protein
MKQVCFRHEVVDSIPEKLQANILYVTADEDVAGHLCACGCGREVITPLSPTDWSITFDRRGATLFPSIGNWAFPCRSHYFIRDGDVVWARDMSDKAIAQGRQRDSARKKRYYERLSKPPTMPRAPGIESLPPQQTTQPSGVQRLLAWLKRMLAR